MMVSELNPVLATSGSQDAFPVSAACRGCGPLKRAVDLVVGSLLAVVAMPVVLAAMALVWLTSRGPVIFTQVRLGRGHRPYTIYKIRTMFHNCEAQSGPKWSTKGDSRVTPVGRLLRRTHVDELPQLWNVLRGEMSLVGPRPERPEFASQLEKAIPGYGDRMQVLPGLTGLAQVQLPPDTTLDDVRRKLALDLYYTRHRDFWLDLRILLSTVSYLLGVPFDVPRTLLRVPDGADVEADARSRDDGLARGEGRMLPAALVGRPNEAPSRDRQAVGGVEVSPLLVGS